MYAVAKRESVEEKTECWSWYVRLGENSQRRRRWNRRVWSKGKEEI